MNHPITGHAQLRRSYGGTKCGLGDGQNDRRIGRPPSYYDQNGTELAFYRLGGTSGTRFRGGTFDRKSAIELLEVEPNTALSLETDNIS